MTAYSELYYADSIELAERLFYMVSSADKWDFEVFVEGFMNSMYREIWDEGSARIINMTWDELLEYLEINCKNIFEKQNA